jgi:hypothetical protein
MAERGRWGRTSAIEWVRFTLVGHLTVCQTSLDVGNAAMNAPLVRQTAISGLGGLKTNYAVARPVSPVPP